MLKQIIFIAGVILILRPAFLAGQWNREQVNSLFSELDRSFKGEEPLTPEDEYYLGRAVAASILAVYKPYTENSGLTNYLNLICQALVINSDRPAVFNSYRVMVLDSGEPNAFSTPGGHIFITKGLLDIVTSEDALAGIIAHELAHVMLKHGLKIIDDMKIVSEADIMARQARAFAGNSGTKILSFRDSVNEIFNSMIKSGYSQPQEYEADTLALKLLADAGYPPGGLLEILDTLKTVRDGGINSTHPSPARRIANIERLIFPRGAPDNRSFRQERFRKIMERN
ncbi:MAG: M48 family metalloprotease [Treponema sp.]|jgi:predicted Zn-dependent protease|nr:M48 family metalloprotease [Treponema sp.]